MAQTTSSRIRSLTSRGVSFRRSVRRIIERKHIVFFVSVTLVFAFILFFGVIWTDYSRFLRVAATGVVFCVCLIGSIVFGLPAAIISAVANIGGVFFSARLFAETGDWYYFSIAVFQVTTAVSSLIIAALTEIERAKTENHLQAALTDPITGVYNRRYFDRRLREEVERSIRTEIATSILFIDLDAFKEVNDNYGHIVGDRVLKQTAGFISQTVRLSDVVCRNGGDEFAVILPDTDSITAEVIGRRVQESFEEFMQGTGVFDPEMGFSLSLGVSELERNASADALMKEADEALYRDKRRRGRGRSA